MRSLSSEILKRREHKKGRYLITGATGFLGSHILVALLKQGHAVVALCRNQAELGGRERIGRLLDWFRLEPAHRSLLTVIEGTLEQPRLGLSEDRYLWLCRQVHEIIHCAAQTQFASRKRSASELVNVTGLDHVLTLAEAGRCDFFHHLSTAYVAGKRSGFCLERVDPAPGFHNVYEETKHLAERLAIRRCSAAGIGLTLYRPAIVYGDSDTGRSIRFNALYYPIKVAHFLKELYTADLANGGKKAAAMGVGAGPDNTLRLPIRIERERSQGLLHLLPVNYFTRVFLHLMMHTRGGDIFHITGDSPADLEQVIDYARRFLGLTGVRTAKAREFGHTPPNGLESLFGSYTKTYRPYMQDTRRFGTQNTDRMLSASGIRCPAFDYPVFERCMAYAVSVDWGKRLFPDSSSLETPHRPTGML